MERVRLLICIASGAFIAACTTNGGGSGADGDVGLGGKADDLSEPAAVVEAADEEMYSDSLRTSVCEAISASAEWGSYDERTAFEQGCLDHEFNVVERTRSTLFAHLDDGRAITLGMKIRVEADGRTFDASLDRVFVQETYRFRWVATAPQIASNRDAYIRDVADEVGEYFSPDDYPDTFRAIAYDAIPQQVRQDAERRAAQIGEELHDEGHTDDGAGIADEQPGWEILRGDEVVGYAIEIWFYIDDPLFDGGGTTLYYNILGDLVEEIDWWG